jgi:RNA polymerase sigma-70 factor (sigma-E family)
MPAIREPGRQGRPATRPRGVRAAARPHCTKNIWLQTQQSGRTIVYRCVVFRNTWAGPPASAVDELYREQAVGMIRLALLLTGDRATAEDVVQDAFLSLCRRWRGLDDPGNAASYLRTSVINGCRSVHRSRRIAWLRRPPQDPPVWSAEAAAINGEDRREVLAAVSGLPHRQREILALRFYLDMSDGEIAAALKVSRGTVSSTVSRALATLARQLSTQQENL